ncbi:ABC transporter ATP-binding protein [soil metagenome]
MLGVRGLRVERGAAVLLDGIDWVVERGEHWAMLGPNGSGKSSLLSAICGYLVPTAGEITLLGKTYGESDWLELKREVGLVSSVVANRMEPGETALGAVISGARGMINFRGQPTRDERERANSLLAQVRAGDLGDRRWGLLSQGERQRVLIARALMSGCGILFLDEPCAGLDPVARQRFLTFLQEGLAAQDGAPSLVLVTHHVEEIIPAMEHVLVLGPGGAVVASGDVREVLRSDILSEAFHAPVRVSRRRGGWSMQVAEEKAG